MIKLWEVYMHCKMYMQYKCIEYLFGKCDYGKLKVT
jgi:hypothetical protein